MCAISVGDGKVSQEVLRSVMSTSTVHTDGYHIDDDEHMAVV